MQKGNIRRTTLHRLFLQEVKTMKSNILASLLLCTGVIVISYPKLSESYYDHKQAELIQEWKSSFQAIQEIDIEAYPEFALITTSVGYEENESGVSGDELSDLSDLNSANYEDEVAQLHNMDGMLYIDAIDLELPILRGATTENLKIAAASINNTAELGEIGNYGVAAHRNLKPGRNFNRLDELKEGDIIRVDNGHRQYEYTVVEKLYVNPEDVWVLEGNGIDREITLVTCHPIGKGTHRLIVKGKMMETSENS